MKQINLNKKKGKVLEILFKKKKKALKSGLVLLKKNGRVSYCASAHLSYSQN